MDVFNLRGALIEDYQSYVESFVHVAYGCIWGKVEGLDGRIRVWSRMRSVSLSAPLQILMALAQRLPMPVFS